LVFTCKIPAKVKTGIFLGKYLTCIYLGVFTFSVPKYAIELGRKTVVRGVVGV